MFAKGLLDDLEPTLAVLAIVAMVALYLRHAAGRYADAKGYRKRMGRLPGKAERTCPHCGTPFLWASRYCDSCKGYPTVAEDPGSVQMMWFMGWFPALVIAAVGGSVATLITWEPWPLVIVLLAGPLLGRLATLACFYGAGRLWWRFSRGEATGAFLVLVSWLGAGPVAAIILTIVVTLAWM